MGYLLDTHVLLWLLGEPERVRPAVRERLADPSVTLFASAASAWEIEVKRALGKLVAPDDLGDQLAAANIAELPLRVAHVLALRALPALHRDPFDRVLVAQARAHDLILVTADSQVRAYPIETLAP